MDAPSLLQTPLFANDVIHAYNFPLGNGRWLKCVYRKTSDGYRWFFEHGGTLVPGDWPAIIARGLSRLPRFGGAPELVYSVGRHSVLMARYLHLTDYGPRPRLLALIHDAPECLGVGDMNTYLKRQIGKAAKSYEDDLVDFIANDLSFGYGLTDHDRELVHATDRVFGESEARLLDMDNGQPWLVSTDASIYQYLLDDGLYDDTPAVTERLWLDQFGFAMDELIATEIQPK